MTDNTVATIEPKATESLASRESYELKDDREGGSEAWLTVFGSFLVYYASFGLVNSFGFFQNYYEQKFLSLTTSSTIAFIGTLQVMLMNILATVSGALCDSYGVKYVFIGSGMGVSCALIMLSFVSPGAVWQVFLVQGLLLGLSIAFGVQPALTAAGQHFKRQRALAMGLVTGGCALGGVFFPIMFSQLVPRIGFSWALRIAALKTAVCYTIAICISTSKHTKRNMKGTWGLPDYKGFFDPKYSVLCVGVWIAQIGIWVPNYYIESYCTTIDANSVVLGYFLPVINGTSIFGMIFGGLIGDRTGRLNLLYPITLVLGLLCSIWLFSSSVAVLVVFSVLFGFFSGMFVALIPSVVSQISPDEKLGARVGAFYSIIALSSLIGTPVGGALITGPTRNGYQGVILYAGCTLTMGALVMLGSRLLHDTNLRARW